MILVVGIDETIEGEEIVGKEGFTGDRNDLLLPKCQQDLIATVMERDTPVVLVNMSGGAVDFRILRITGPEDKDIPSFVRYRL